MSEQNGMSFNLAKEADLQRLGDTILADIDKHAQETMDGGHRRHLGASQIGEQCRRKLWYQFRWCSRETFVGRILRLFDRGHREEERNNTWLRAKGFEVYDFDYSKPQKADGSYPQYQISGCGGHFGGSTDGVIKFPERYNINEFFLLEHKTNGTGAGFNGLRNDGMPKHKPQHWAQTCTYGYKMGLNYVLYMNTNKNDDDMFVRPYKLDHSVGQHMEAKAEAIIIAREAPNRLSDNPTNFQCKMCCHAKVCHAGELPEVNCRSCKHAVPADNKEWFCEVHNANIPEHIIPEACNSYEPITVC
jgi:hypothetical protein